LRVSTRTFLGAWGDTEEARAGAEAEARAGADEGLLAAEEALAVVEALEARAVVEARAAADFLSLGIGARGEFFLWSFPNLLTVAPGEKNGGIETRRLPMVVRFVYVGNASADAAAFGRRKGSCLVRVVEDPAVIRAIFDDLGVDMLRNIGSKIVLPAKETGGGRGKKRRPTGDSTSTVIQWFDPTRPTISALAVASTVATLLRKDGETRVRLSLGEVASPARRSAVLVTVAKACFDGHGPTSGSSDAVVEFVLGGRGTEAAAAGEDLERIVDTIFLAADLENRPSNLVGPKALAAHVAGWFGAPQGGLKAPRGRTRAPIRAPGRAVVHHLDRHALEREGMGLVLGVGRSGEREPCMTVIELPGVARGSTGGAARGAAGARGGTGGARGAAATVVLIGKGVTYDAGGLAIKPLESMLGMHADKSGASVAAAVLRYFADPAVPPLPFRLVALLPAVENVVSSRAVHPGDVLTACDGTTVEVVNPDAEGRLILADAAAYAGRRYGADVRAVVDFATLTTTGDFVAPNLGAVFYTPDDATAAALTEAGEALGERCWRMPVWEEFSGALASEVADVKNSGWSTNADGFMAALFIRRFLPESCVASGLWAHVDISGNTSLASAFAGGAGGGTGGAGGATGGAGAATGGNGEAVGGGGGPFVGTGVALGIRLVQSFAKRDLALPRKTSGTSRTSSAAPRKTTGTSATPRKTTVDR
jgi:leucyl aminopeptidase